MAKYAEEIEKMIHVSFQGSIDNVSEETRHTILLYHQVSKSLLLFSILYIILTCSSASSVPPGRYYSLCLRND